MAKKQKIFQFCYQVYQQESRTLGGISWLKKKNHGNKGILANQVWKPKPLDGSKRQKTCSELRSRHGKALIKGGLASHAATITQQHPNTQTLRWNLLLWHCPRCREETVQFESGRQGQIWPYLSGSHRAGFPINREVGGWWGSDCWVSTQKSPAN